LNRRDQPIVSHVNALSLENGTGRAACERPLPLAIVVAPQAICG